MVSPPFGLTDYGLVFIISMTASAAPATLNILAMEKPITIKQKIIWIMYSKKAAISPTEILLSLTSSEPYQMSKAMQQLTPKVEKKV
jgi:hypothetical protein